MVHCPSVQFWCLVEVEAQAPRLLAYRVQGAAAVGHPLQPARPVKPPPLRQLGTPAQATRKYNSTARSLSSWLSHPHLGMEEQEKH